MHPKQYFIAKQIRNVHSPSTPEKSPDMCMAARQANIFKEKPSDTNFQQQPGPRFTREGEILKHTLVGKSDWFLRYASGKKTYFDESTIRVQKHQNKQGDDEKSVAMKASDVKSVARKQTQSDKKYQHRVREQLRTKNQILDEIQMIRQRISDNRLLEEQQQQGMEHTSASRDERVLRRFASQQQLWNSIATKVSGELGRDANLSQLVRADTHRYKLETAMMFEAMKSDFENFGSKVWYMTLRQDKHDQVASMVQKYRGKEVIVEKDTRNQLIISSDLPEAFRHSSLSNLKAQVEIIRKPDESRVLGGVGAVGGAGAFHSTRTSSLHTLNTSYSSSSTVPFQSFKSDQYLRKQLQKLTSSGAPSHLLPSSEADGMLVVGKNQLDLEANQILNDGLPTSTFYRKMVPPKVSKKKDAEAILEEEILAENYEKSAKSLLPPIKSKHKKHASSSMLTKQNSFTTNYTKGTANVTEIDFQT